MTAAALSGAALFASALLTTALLAHWLVPRLAAWQLMDLPNHRSSHTVPVPRGGGLAPVTVILAFGTVLTLFGLDGPARLLVLMVLIAALGLGAVSLLDDRRSLGIISRLGGQALAAGAVLLGLAMGELLTPGLVSWLPIWFPVLLVGWLWFINLVNFMDGIDGISSIEMASLGLGACLVVLAGGAPGHWLGAGLAPVAEAIITGAGLLLAGAAAGFLVVNWHPARVFLGDVGSVPLGFLSGALLLLLALAGHPAPALILPAYYIVDATVTLAKRVWRREKLTQGHRSHAYQVASHRRLGHAGVCWRLVSLNVCLVLLALGTILAPPFAWAAVAAAYLASLLVFADFLRS